MIGYDDQFLDEAVSRYKSFLHLSKMLLDRNMNLFCVPTHDIDLIWHTHQLYPTAYCTDLTVVFGKVLDHKDRDSAGSRENGKNNLQLMFIRTKELWEDTYRYMYCVDGVKQHKLKDEVVRCFMDHVPGLSTCHHETQSKLDKRAVSCFITCSLTDDAANRANCIINCYMGVEGTKQDGVVV